MAKCAKKEEILLEAARQKLKEKGLLIDKLEGVENE